MPYSTALDFDIAPSKMESYFSGRQPVDWLPYVNWQKVELTRSLRLRDYAPMRIVSVVGKQLAVCAFLASIGGEARAYNAPGHFYTVSYALAELLDPSPSWAQDRMVIAFCTWLPDASVELSATGTLGAAASSYSMTAGADVTLLHGLNVLFAHPLGTYGLIGCGTNPDPQRIDFDERTMEPVVIVQQFIHGLTGADPATTTSIAVQLASNLWTQAKQEKDPSARIQRLCATGFAMHLLGDSYAHRHLIDQHHSSEAPMYSTGCGHASAPDGGHLPDCPLDFARRWQDWQEYFATIAKVFGTDFKANTTVWFTQLMKPLSNSSDENECLLEEELWQRIVTAPSKAPNPCSHPGFVVTPDLGIPCHAFVARSAQKGLIDRRLSCPEAWEHYKEAALPLFSAPGAIAPKFDYNNPAFGTAGFYKKAQPQWQP